MNKYFFKKNPWAKYLFIGLGLILIYRLYKRAVSTATNVVNGIKSDAVNLAINDALQNDQIAPIRTQAVTNIAESIYSAFYKNDWFGASEDEQAAILAFNQLQSNNEAIACASIYRAAYGKSLYKNMTDFIHSWNGFDDIKTGFLNSIKTL